MPTKYVKVGTRNVPPYDLLSCLLAYAFVRSNADIKRGPVAGKSSYARQAPAYDLMANRGFNGNFIIQKS